jgi:beta-glucosidase
MKTKNKASLFRGLTFTFGSVLAIVLGASYGAFLNEANINENLGTSSREFVKADASTARFKSDYSDWKAMTAAKHENIKETAGEGMVLLKNDGVLPLASTVEKVNVFGRNSDDPAYGGGGGAGKVSDPNVVNVTNGFKEAGLEVNPTLMSYYSTCEKRKVGGMRSAVYTTGEADPSAYPTAVTDSLADYGDTAVLWLTRCIGEGDDPSNDSKLMELDDNEKKLIAYIEGLASVKKIVLVLNEDNTLGVGALANDSRINAIIHVGGLGINGTEALGAILKGQINPSGHLTDTYAAYSLSSPAAQNSYNHVFTNKTEVENYVGGSKEFATNYIAEKEGIYIGYRYYETRYEDIVLGQGSANNSLGCFMGESTWDYSKEVCYPFGYGLSYTTFDQNLDSVNVKDKQVTAKVTVENKGSVAGKSVVELYAQSPYTAYDKENNVEKSAIQLAGFGKTGTIAPGGKETIEVTFKLENIASYDYTKAKTYIMDAGNYYFAIGDSAHDALNNVIAAKDAAKASLGKAAKAYKYNMAGTGPDITTYAVSSVTGAKITNLFDRADYNYFNKGAYKYLTRNDWSTYPTTEDSLTATDEMMKELSGQASLWDNHDYSNGDFSGVKNVTTNGKGTDDITSLYGNSDYNDPTWTTVLNKMSVEEMCTLTQGNSLTRPVPSINYAGTVDGDGPAGFSGTYGDVNTDNTAKLTARTYQSECMLACTWNQDLAYKEGSFMGEDGLYLGKTSIWAPGVDLHRTPYSARNFEYYSEDSMMAYYMGAKQCKGMQDKGNIACPKHFAFNDQEHGRCSLVNFINEQEARELQLRSFQGSFTEGGALGTMTSFSRIGLTYAGASHALMTDILRGEWGFKGYTVTDYAAWQFMHAVECVKAGTDMFDTTNTTYSDVVLAGINGGDTELLACLRRANKRVLYAVVNSHAVDGTSVVVTPWWKAGIYWIDSGIGVITLALAGVYVFFEIKSRKEGAK